jgi:intergrase/recombinase
MFKRDLVLRQSGLADVGVARMTSAGLTIHDLRRSVVRNLIRAGVSRAVAMSITGHKTERVFKRYNITFPDDIREALPRLASMLRFKNAPVAGALR